MSSTSPSSTSRPALATVSAFLAQLESSEQGSRALRRQRSWALREAVLFAAVRRVRSVRPATTARAGELTDEERVLAVRDSAQVTIGELFSDEFIEDWLARADPVLRGVDVSNGATQRARMTSLRALAAFTGADLPEHRHPKPILRTLLSEPEISSALRALTRQLPGRGPDDHVRLAAVLAVMSVWPARSAGLAALQVSQVRPHGEDLLLAVDAAEDTSTILRGVAADRVREWLQVREGLVGALLGGPVHALWTSIRSNSRPDGTRGSLPLPPGMPLKVRGLQRAYARSVEAANMVHDGLSGFPLPRSLDLLRRSLDAHLSS